MILLFLFLFSFFLFFNSSPVHAAWTPLIQASDFDGIRTDMLATASGIVTILLIIVGLGLLIRSLNR